MKRVGNAASNKVYNADNKRPPVPIDADEADSAMERFIRSKYMQADATVSTSTNGNRNRNGNTNTNTDAISNEDRNRHGNGTRRHNTGSTGSDDDAPPPLPPKNGSKFFGRSGSTFALSFRSKKSSQHSDSQRSPRDPPPRSPMELRSKPSKVFGTSVHDDSSEDLARKLAQLRDMGFTDDKRNAMVLRGVNGNIEKTIEALVRLGEGGSTGNSLVSPRGSSLPTPRSISPGPVTPVTLGLSKASPTASHSPAPSNNPWDISPAQPQSSQSTGNLQSKNPYSNNPFGMPTQQAEFTLNQSLLNLSLTPSQQPPSLFPHHTGGVPMTQPVQQPIYQQSMTPPIPQAYNFASIAFNSNQTYPQPFQQPQQPQQNYNPFLQSPAAQQPLSVNTSPFPNQVGYGSNPFTRSPTRIASPTLNQIPEQSQQNFYGSPQSMHGNNPFFAMNQPAQQPQSQPAQFNQTFYQPQQQQQQQQQPMPQAQQMYQPQRHDKSSIMALYNYPSPAATPLQPQGLSAPNGGTNLQVAPTQQQAPIASPQRSFTAPLPVNKNPFFNGAASPASSPFAVASSPAPAGGARSRESMTLGYEMAWNNGRHSPDAFASLSARGS
jgi:hypothetical protein